MKLSILPLLLTIAGGLIYHLGSKGVPRDLNPFAGIIAAYLTGIMLCAIAWLSMAGHESLTWPTISAPAVWAVLGIGLGAAMIELGFLLTYRAGWSLGETSILVNAGVAALLVPAGLLLFRESFSISKAAGLLCCLLGLFLLARK
ncbi:MAG: hypothetical protein ACKV2V_22605 [Blastocatellia bacterium]